MSQEFSQEVLEQAEKLVAKQAAKREKTKENLAKYPHANPDTLQFDEDTKKYSVEIECEKCGASRRVYTSDLFQVRTCVDCADKAKKEKAAKKRADIKAAMEFLKQKANGEVEEVEETDDQE